MGPLLSPQRLRRLSRPFVLLDARTKAAYDAGHLPGALPADLEADLSTAAGPGHDPANGGRHPLPSPEAWAARLGAWGVAPGVPVVVYDDAGGGNAAARAWWMLRAAGHTACAVLDGGLQAAAAEGFGLVTEAATLAPRPPMAELNWSLPRADTEAAAACASDPAWKLLDVRSRERWRGEAEPIDPVPGRIPGSVNLPWTENLDSDGRFRPAADLRDLYLRLLDGTPADRLVVHCGSGVTACHTLLALDLAGLPGAALYVGSWSEWCRSGRPITGGPG